MANPFCHIELLTENPGQAKEFFGQLFDWKFEDFQMPEGTYTMINVGEGTGGGMMKNPIPNTPSHWLAYVQIDDLQAYTEKAKSLGATICKEITEIPETGSFSVIQDPTGAVLALWEPKKK